MPLRPRISIFKQAKTCQMLKFTIVYQESYSRLEMIFRTLFGWLYIGIPHGLAMLFFSIVLLFMSVAGFFIILFTGVTPRWYYEWTVKLNRWTLRVGARLCNLAEGYPDFGMDGKDDKTVYDLAFWQISQGQLLLRFFLGWLYMGIPHLFVLYFRMIGTFLLSVAAFFVVLFTGKYPEDWHRFNTGTLRWMNRVNLYLGWLYRDYPPFSGQEDADTSFEFEKN